MPRSFHPNFDAIWKAALKHFLPEFFEFFYYEYWECVDWSRGYLLLEQELEKLTFSQEPSLLIVDKVARVYLRESMEQTALFHVEVQVVPSKDMARRMYNYRSRLQDLNMGPIASFALFVGKKGSGITPEYKVTIIDSGVRFHCEVKHLEDYREELPKLFKKNNPFALMTAAHLLWLDLQDDEIACFREKWRVIKILLDKQWGKKRTFELLKIIDGIMRVSAELEVRLWRKIMDYLRRNEMDWMCPFEKMIFEKGARRGVSIGRKIGIGEGMEQGLEKGLKQGERAGAAALLERQLTIRFGEVPDLVKRKLQKADSGKLAVWGEALLEAETLKQVFRSGGK